MIRCEPGVERDSKEVGLVFDYCVRNNSLPLLN